MIYNIHGENNNSQITSEMNKTNVTKENNDLRELKIKKNIIGKLSSLFVKRFELTLLLIGMIIVLGVTSFILLPKESLPEIVFPTLTVQTVYPGANPLDVENLVTTPLEDKLSGLDDVEGITSSSNYGFSFITVSFNENVDIDQKKIELDGALAEVALPDDSFEPTSSTFNTSQIPLISLSLAGDYSLNELTGYGETLVKELESVNGVDDVLLFGGVEREIRVTLDEDKLEEANLSADNVTQVLQGDNISFPLGEIQVEDTRFSLRIDERLNEVQDISNTIITNQLGEAFTIAELGTVEDTTKNITQFNRSFTTEDGLNNSVFISVIRKNRSDVVGTSESVKETVESSIGSVIPADLNVVISRDTATQVEDDLSSIQNNALSGLLVVILVLFLFIGFRESLIVSITIPLTLLATLGVLSFFGITLNTFAILGLIVALGLLVDNTIIVMENMDRLAKKGATPKQAAIFGTNQVGFPIASATLTTVAAFFPLAILPGIIGAFINTIPRTIIITLVSSLALAITITPSVYYFVNKRIKLNSKSTNKWLNIGTKLLKLIFVAALSVIAFYGDDVWIGIPIIATLFFVGAMILKEFVFGDKALEDNRVVSGYKNFIMSVTKSRFKMALIGIVALAVFASSITLITNERVKIAFFPQTEPNSITVNVDTAPGTSLEETADIIGTIEAVLMDSDNIAQFNTTIGGNEIDSGVINMDLVDNDINGFDQLEIIRESLSDIKNADISFVATGAGGPPVGKPIEVKIIGDDIEANKVLSQSFVAELEEVNGTFNIDNSIKEGSKELLFDIDQEKAKELGLNSAYIGFSLRKLLDGEVATTIKDNGEVIDVRVKLANTSIENLEETTIQTPFGTDVTLDEIVTIKESVGIAGVVREDGKRTITISSDLVNGVNASDALEQFKTRIDTYELPEGTTVSFGGESAGISESFGDLFRSLIIAIFLVFIILTVQFSSVKQPFAIIMTIPMALIGVLYGLMITGNEFGFYAFMAIVSLVGIAVNDAIVLIDYMNYLRKEGYDFFEAIGEATRTRFNPVLATTLTTIGGILPLSFKNSYYAQFGYSLIFGLLVTTLMTLVLIPVMYSLLEGRKARKELRLNKVKDEKVVLKNRYQN